MITIRTVTMFCLSAKSPIKIVSGNNKNSGGNDEQKNIFSKKMFYYQ